MPIMYMKTKMKYIVLCATIWSFSTSYVKTQKNENVALNKPTVQDGELQFPTLNPSAYWVSKNAVDGMKNCQNVNYLTYSGTTERSRPWWQVDLGDVYSIEDITVYGRQTEQPYQLKGFQVYLSLQNDTSSENHVYNNTGSYGNGQFTDVIPEGIKYVARYVTIVLPKSAFSGRANDGPLVLCEVEVYGIPISKDHNIAPIAEISNSSVLSYGDFNYSAVNVKDQHLDASPDQCNCCWSSGNELNPWIQAVLPDKAPVVTINIIGRTDDLKRDSKRNLFGLQVIIDDDTVPVSRTMYNATTNTVIVYPHTQNVKAIKLTRQGSGGEWYLIVCEILINRRVCNYRSFGHYCLSICHCRDNTSCDAVFGICPTGLCDPGWKGSSCDKVCDYRSFGYNCSTTCHCYANSSCDAAIGTCSMGLCDPGWQGSSCDKGCDYRSFGYNCSLTCHCRSNTSCDAVSGNCSLGLCERGWQGSSCDKECDYRSFGYNCSSTCHCRSNTSCDPVSGKCSIGLCEPGWRGSSCDKVCNYRLFGFNCSSICNCRDNTSCDAVTGWCSTRLCDPGWQGSSCDKACDYRYFGNNCSSMCNCRDNTSCDASFGQCSTGLCMIGWQGSSCDKVCDYRSFGYNCSSTCHCNDNSSCDVISGNCTTGFCDPGWQGSSCDKVCDYRSFGDNCSSICHCKDNTTCDAVSGMCLASFCDSGWQGSSCMKATEAPTDNQDSSPTAAVVGGVSAAVSFLALCIGIGFIMFKRRNAKDSERNQFPNLDKALKSKEARRSEQPRSNIHAEEENRSFEGHEGPGDGDYYSFGDHFIGIRIHEFWDYIKEKMENECEKLFTDFMTLPRGLAHASKSADDIGNRGKNRYKEMYAYDHSRVVLLDVEDGKNTDYINACYINIRFLFQGYDKNKKFVASQGPYKDMVDDFWRMVWQLKSDKIVMVTNLVEMGTTKCSQYWPKDDEEGHCFGNIFVKVLKTDISLDFNLRHFEVRKIGEPVRRIRQFHFKSWPDKDVPDSTWSLVNFWRAVDTNEPSEAGPIVVHCSAGVGRTGTFIAMDNLVSQARTEGCMRPLQVVDNLRRQRVNMVQTKEQYVYLHEAVADALLIGTHFVWTKQFQDMLHFMLKKENDGTRTNLELQFELIQRSIRDTTYYAADTADYSNVETLQSESAAYRPKLRDRGSKLVQELGAIYISNYKGKNTFVITMSPDKSTMEEFWSLVDDNNIKTIIMLTETTAASYQSSCQLGSSPNNGNRFSVNKIEEKIRKCYTERTFTFKESDSEDEECLTTVKQFQCTTWKTGYTVPGETRSLLDMVDSVEKWQPHLSETQPVLIHCSDGRSRSSILCVLLNELQRMKHEGGHINIVESVKMIKKQQEHLIDTYDQYRFCFDLILAHMKNTEVYENL